MEVNKMSNKIQKIKDCSLVEKVKDLIYRGFYEGFAAGVAISATTAIGIDMYSDRTLDHPALLIPAFVSVVYGLRNYAKYGSGLGELERKLEERK
jgi:hypothetical protein